MAAGQEYRVESHSFDRRSVWHWRAELVGRAPSLLVLRSKAGEGIVQGDRIYPWPDDTLQFYWSDRWYTIRAALHDGEPYFFSCTVAMPASFHNADGRVSYVDLDLELAVTDGLSARVEGEEDFQQNIAQMSYPPDVVSRARDAVRELQSLVRAGRPPFRNHESLFLRRAL